MIKPLLSFFLIINLALADEMSENLHNALAKELNTNSFDKSTEQNSATKENDYKTFFIEFGVGYMKTNYKATQKAVDRIYISENTITDIYERQSYPKKGVGNGRDVFLTLNMCVTQRFGINVGIGGEFIKVKWQSPLLDYNYRNNDASKGEVLAERHFSIDSISKDTLINMYFTLGAFYNIWQGKKRAVRIFGNTGWGMSDFLKSSFDFDAESHKYMYAEGVKQRFYTFGVRYIFVKKHGIELASRLKGKFQFNGNSAVKTDITWGHTLNLRYVYGF